MINSSHLQRISTLSSFPSVSTPVFNFTTSLFTSYLFLLETWRWETFHLFVVQVSLRPHTLPGHCTGVLCCATMVSSCALICPDFSGTAATFKRIRFMLTTPTLKAFCFWTQQQFQPQQYTFPRVFFIYALWIHIQGVPVVWAKQHKYCKISKPKGFYLMVKKKCSVRIKFACVSLPLFLPLLRYCWALIRIL